MTNAKKLRGEDGGRTIGTDVFDILTRWHNKRDNGGNNPTRHTTNCSPDATHHQSQQSPEVKEVG